MNRENNMEKIALLAGALGIGDAMVDLFTKASQLPPRGGNIWSSAVEIHSGGTVANVAANLAKLGIPSAFAGIVGGDPYGKFLIDDFERCGVDTRWIEAREGSYTGIVLAIIDDDGERTFIACAKGASHIFLTPEYANKLTFKEGEIIHSSGVCLGEEPARTGLLTALQKVHDQKHLLYFDPNLRLEGNIFPEELKKAQLKAISLADVVLIGNEEIALIYPDKSMEEAIRTILAGYTKLVVVKEGEKGASAYTNGSEEHSPAFKIEVVSTAGAGDSFDAGFIAARMRGASVRDSLVYANAVASIKVSRKDSRSVPGHEEVIKFLSARGCPLKL
jgi:fructokinase/2-dehydro-3-deoxygluconokinase